MINRYLYGLIVILLFGCSQADLHEELPVNPGNDQVKVNVVNPRYSYLRTDGNSTVYENMPDSSTIRLFIYKTAPGLPPNPHKDNLVKQATLRVLGKNEYPNKPQGSTILCEVDPNGKVIRDITESDLHLPASLYQFYAISPAILIDTLEAVPSHKVNHGDKIMIRTTAPQTFNIGYNSGEITGGTPGFFNLTPKPFTLLTTRLKFKLRKGDKVRTMDIEKRGIKVSNLTTAPYTRYNFYLGNDTLTTMEDVTAEAGTVTLTDYYYDESDETYNFETEILPNRAGEVLNVEFRFHLLMNGNNYKAYIYNVNKEFKRGYSYNYDVKVNVGGIFVTGWTTSGFETEIKE